jgi:hypothetical protein
VYEKTNVIYEKTNMQQLEDIEKIIIFEKEGKESVYSSTQDIL